MALEAFNKSRSTPDGLADYCRTCIAAYKKAWRLNNLDKARAFEAVQRKRYREKRRVYRLSHLEHHKTYVATHREQIKAHKLKWARAHPDHFRAKEAKRRAKKRGNGGSFTAQEWQYLCQRWLMICLACGTSGRLTADHVVPIVHGGSSDLDNIQPLCGPCNSSKGTKTVDYREGYD